GESDGADEPGFDSEDAAALHSALAGLDVRHREVLALHFLEDLSVAEVADVLDLPDGTVKSQTSRALHRLQTALDTTRKEARP
ncbi:MAG TPA: sigma-70 family RNA polymerase sigma factor, partial [Nocardioides sp.]|nr:sigma-70 family RNA polymerase sigma factor [Nocardioides sp.]